MFTVSFEGKTQGATELERELSLLACATKAGAELTHRCGGHARCGTCLVTITAGADRLTPAGLSEQRILKILKATPDQRLACQAWAQGDVTCAVGDAGKDLRGGR
jgi:adenylate cyclase